MTNTGKTTDIGKNTGIGMALLKKINLVITTETVQRTDRGIQMLAIRDSYQCQSNRGQ